DDADHVARHALADGHEGGQFALLAAVPGDDGAEVGMDRLGFLREAGQRPGARVGVARREGNVRADDTEAVAAGGQAGQQVGEAEPWWARGDGGERTAHLGRGGRFGVERVEVAWRAPEPDKDHGAGASARAGLGGVDGGQAKGEWERGAGAEEVAAGDAG